MIDVKEVIEGTYVPENMFQALEASVVVDELQAQVNKGKGQVFTYCLVVARNHYVKMKQVFEQGGWNDPETPWYIAAKAGFTEEAEQAIAQGNIRFEGQSFKTFENAVRTLKLAMERNAPLDERDDRKFAHSLRFALPRMTAPALRRRLTRNASAAGT